MLKLAAMQNISVDIYNDTSNVTSNETFSYRFGKVPSPPLYLLVSVTVVMAVIFIVGVIGNILVVIVVGCSRNMRSVVNIYLLNLCIADLLLLFLCMPPALSELHAKDVWIFGEFMCKLVPFLEILVASSSIFTIMAISMERFRVVWKPLSSNNCTSSRTICAVICIWFLAIIISLPMISIVKYKDSMMKDGTPIKVCRLPITTNWKKCYVIVNQVIMYVIPVLILSGLYSKIICQLRSSSHNAVEFKEEYVCNKERFRIRRQVINTILCIVIVFFICHLPFRVISLVFIFGDQRILRNLGLERYLNLLYFSRCLLYANHALNPILYNFVSTKFRSALKILIFQDSRRSSERRYPSPGVLLPREAHKVIFKQKETSTANDPKSSNNERDSGSTSSESQRRKERKRFTQCTTRTPTNGQQDKSKLLVTEKNSPCKSSDECVSLDIQDKSSAKVRFIMTQEGYVIGITMQKLKQEDKNVQTF